MIRQLGPPTARGELSRDLDDTVVEGDVLRRARHRRRGALLPEWATTGLFCWWKRFESIARCGLGPADPLSRQDLVPIVEVHAREPDDDDEAMALWLYS